MRCNVTLSLLALLLALFTPGCGSGSTPVTAPTTTASATPAVPVPLTPTQIAQNVSDITLFTTNGVNLGLAGLASANVADAKAIATQIQIVVPGVVLPLLKGSGGITTDAINTILKEKFTTGFPATAASIITGVAAILDRYIAQPSGTTFLTAEDLQYATAFFQSMSDGAGMYLANAAVVAPAAAPIKLTTSKFLNTPRAGGWLNLTATK